jgi:hypothetical protein
LKSRFMSSPAWADAASVAPCSLAD